MRHEQGFLYGCDYNPEQWKDRPDILAEDIRLMKEAGCNVVSLGIFAWSELEPEDGRYDFTFFDRRLDTLAENGIGVFLATPSGAKPAWMAQKYPEVLRVDERGVRQTYGGRHNHCFTSPVYRAKIRRINEQLAKRYGQHPALLGWHVSNEYGGECHCPLCAEAFRSWLRQRYHGDLKELNRAWWTGFWSHTYTDWEQIAPPSPIGENGLQGLKLDWKWFVTAQTLDFFRCESEPLRRLTPDLPITTNFHGDLWDLDYRQFVNDIDIASWDIYPMWHMGESMADTACRTAFVYDLCRSLKNAPFLLMESTPSNVNWADVCKTKRPGVNALSSLQAIACGADSVQYFQWRKSRGGEEKFHGAVVDHYGGADTRVFREVAALGGDLRNLAPVAGSKVKSKVAVIYDWDTRWAIEYASGFHKGDRGYVDACMAHYRYFWENGFNVDIVSRHSDLSQYQLVAAPMLYMAEEAVAEKLCDYVRNGGILVSGYLCGYVDEHDLCHLGGFPGGRLKELFGVWNEEIDCLCPQEENHVNFKEKSYPVRDFFEHIHLRGAQALGAYSDGYLSGNPAVTTHRYGEGSAYYMAFREDDALLREFYRDILPPEQKLPDGVTLRTRRSGNTEYRILQNWNETPVKIDVPENWKLLLPAGETPKQLDGWGTWVLQTDIEEE